VGRCAETAARMATDAFSRAIEAVLEKGARVAGCGLLLASGRPLPQLASILASHALIHTADGELFRDAIRSAAAASGLPVTAVRERELWAQAGQKLGDSAESIERRVAALGKALGPPWRADEKLATGVALLALVRAR
jgi:SH3-like domain-containing protein